MCEQQKKAKKDKEIPIDPLDFLEDCDHPVEGFARIADVCTQLPPEWCVLQLCKGFNTATTYSTFYDIAVARGDIYVALLRHCRTPELGPTCLRFDGDALGAIFREYGTLVERFRGVVSVNPLAITQEAKATYWKKLYAFGDDLKVLNTLLTVGQVIVLTMVGNQHAMH